MRGGDPDHPETSAKRGPWTVPKPNHNSFYAFPLRKDLISVENTGSGENDVIREDQGLLQRFVDYIKTKKTVSLEDLAQEFGLKVQECINRVNGLEQMGRLSGVMDDRGKFIYISEEEMRAVADYLGERGRVSIAELARKSNEFIDLSAKQQQSVSAAASGS